MLSFDDYVQSLLRTCIKSFDCLVQAYQAACGLAKIEQGLPASFQLTSLHPLLCTPCIDGHHAVFAHSHLPAQECSGQPSLPAWHDRARVDDAAAARCLNAG